MTRFLRHIFFLSLCFLSFNSVAATLSSTVNRNQISTNETLTLNVSIDEQVNTSSLDLSALKHDFEVLAASPQSRSSINTINGRSVREATTVWNITLIAKREGRLTIPAFSIGSARSQPIVITVNDSAQTKASNRPLEVTLTSSRSKVYPNQQFIITVELSAARDVRNLSGAQLNLADATIEALDQQSFQRVDAGIARQIVILKYAIFAQKAGTITIPALTYTGLRNGSRGFFGNSGEQVVGRSKAIDIQVKDIPASANNNGRSWFTADEVAIKSEWSGDSSALDVGQPITRTITITAKGQQASAIPPLNQTGNIEGLKSYKDQAQLETGKTRDGFVATRVESEAIVANKAGSYKLPAQTIEWWSNKGKTWQVARIPAETLIVTGTSVSSNTPQQNTAITNLIQSQTNTQPTTSNIPSKQLLTWQIATALLGLLVLFQWYLLGRKPSNKTLEVNIKTDRLNEKPAWSALQKLLKKPLDNSNDVAALRAAILNWANSHQIADSPLNLKQIAEVSGSKQLAIILANIDFQLYTDGGDRSNDNLSGLASELEKFRSMLNNDLNKDNVEKTDLKKLYPG